MLGITTWQEFINAYVCKINNYSKYKNIHTYINTNSILVDVTK